MHSDPPMLAAGLVTGIVFLHIGVKAFKHNGFHGVVAVGHVDFVPWWMLLLLAIPCVVYTIDAAPAGVRRAVPLAVDCLLSFLPGAIPMMGLPGTWGLLVLRRPRRR